MSRIEAFLADGRAARTTLRRNVEHVLDGGRAGYFAESVVVRSRAMHELLERNDRLETLVRELAAQVRKAEEVIRRCPSYYVGADPSDAFRGMAAIDALWVS